MIDKVLLTKRQFNILKNIKKDEKGVRIEFSYNELRAIHTGGLLQEILEFVENNIPYAIKLTPIIRKGGAPLTKVHAVSMISEWINKELDKVITRKGGSGLNLNMLKIIELKKQLKKIRNSTINSW